MDTYAIAEGLARIEETLASVIQQRQPRKKAQAQAQAQHRPYKERCQPAMIDDNTKATNKWKKIAGKFTATKVAANFVQESNKNKPLSARARLRQHIDQIRSNPIALALIREKATAQRKKTAHEQRNLRLWNEERAKIRENTLTRARSRWVDLYSCRDLNISSDEWTARKWATVIALTKFVLCTPRIIQEGKAAHLRIQQRLDKRRLQRSRAKRGVGGGKSQYDTAAAAKAATEAANAALIKKANVVIDDNQTKPATDNSLAMSQIVKQASALENATNVALLKAAAAAAAAVAAAVGGGGRGPFVDANLIQEDKSEDIPGMSSVMAAAAKAANEAVGDIRRSQENQSLHLGEVNDGDSSGEAPALFDGERAMTEEEISAADAAAAAAAASATFASTEEDANDGEWHLEPLDNRLFDMFQYDWYIRSPKTLPALPCGYDIQDFYTKESIAASVQSTGIKSSNNNIDPIIAEAIQIAKLMGVDLVAELKNAEISRDEERISHLLEGTKVPYSDMKKQKSAKSNGKRGKASPVTKSKEGSEYINSQHIDVQSVHAGHTTNKSWHHGMPRAKWFGVTKSSTELKELRRQALHHTSILVLDAVREFHSSFFADPKPPLHRPTRMRTHYHSARVFHPTDHHPAPAPVKSLACGDPYSETALQFRPRQHLREIPPGLDPHFLKKAYNRLKQLEKMEQETESRMAAVHYHEKGSNQTARVDLLYS